METEEHTDTETDTDTQDVAGDSCLYRVYLAAEHGEAPTETAILLDLETQEAADVLALGLAALLGIECQCQVAVRPVELYV